MVKLFLLILCLEIDINIIKREVVYSSFLLILFLFYFLFFLSDGPSPKITIILTKRTSNIFTSTSSLCFYVLIVYLSIWFFGGFLGFFVCV